jgi:hypothetical protein
MTYLPALGKGTRGYGDREFFRAAISRGYRPALTPNATSRPAALATGVEAGCRALRIIIDLITPGWGCYLKVPRRVRVSQAPQTALLRCNLRAAAMAAQSTRRGRYVKQGVRPGTAKTKRIAATRPGQIRVVQQSASEPSSPSTRDLRKSADFPVLQPSQFELLLYPTRSHGRDRRP